MNRIAIRRFSEGRKLIKLRANRPIVQSQRKRNELLEENAKALGLEWRIIAASVLHRYPIVSADVEPWENDMWEMEYKIELKRREHFMGLVGGTDAQVVSPTSPTIEEIIETMPFKPAPRITEADETNDRKSLERKLPRSLFLMVKRNRTDHEWQFPQGKLAEGETLRMAAERVIDRAVGNIRRYFISNAPIGHYCYAYPPAIQKQRNQYGAKVFFYRTQLIEGNIKLETKLYKDFVWVSREEVREYVDEDTAEYLDALLLE